MATKSPKFNIEINYTPRFSGRIIGFIDETECRAILNTKGAPRKISTAEGLDERDIAASLVSGKRFVVVTDDMTKGKIEIFVSPIIKYAVFSRGVKGFFCGDQNEYSFRKIQ